MKRHARVLGYILLLASTVHVAVAWATVAIQPNYREKYDPVYSEWEVVGDPYDLWHLSIVEAPGS